MMRTGSFLLVVLVIALLIVLTACAEPSDPRVNEDGVYGETQYFTVNTPQGSIPCITWKQYNAGGVSCDWSK
jgi:hypothetical protein